jgi:diadenosine tetraphosphatase ApaH/serine/threonine PP2A family protein phosphatase
MRYLILSDIHANLEALDSCLQDAALRGYDETLVLGDLVGYGADPDAVVDRIVALAPTAIVRGNHDKVASGVERPEGFNAVARRAAQWTFETLTPAHRSWLAALPAGPHTVDDLVEICHGSPFDEDTYLFDDADAARGLHVSARPLCLFGHTHYAIAYVLKDEDVDVIRSEHAGEATLEVEEGAKYLLNPGSVGQPRDGDPRAAYAIVDTTRRLVELYRLEYDVETAQSKILDAGLPEPLARRLAVGR